MKPSKRIVDIFRITWLLICFGIGLSYFSKGELAGEHVATFIVLMSIVTFPVGFLAVYILKAMIWILWTTLGVGGFDAYGYALSLWVLMTVMGYFQWFYGLPKLLAIVKAARTT